MVLRVWGCDSDRVRSSERTLAQKPALLPELTLRAGSRYDEAKDGSSDAPVHKVPSLQESRPPVAP
jgi:hypothetical protein